jgi:hypothetical protein
MEAVMNKTLMQIMIAAGMLASAGAQAIVINVNDGSLADWGVHHNGLSTDWVPTANSGIQATIEDQKGDVRLDPGYGGQAYDAEALYAVIQGNYLYIALATGHNPNTENTPAGNSYGAGDFAIDFGKNGTYEMGINVKPIGSVTFGDAGGVYKNPTWALGLWNTAGAYDPYNPDTKNPTSLTAGDLIGSADLHYTTTPQTGYGQWSNAPHYFYEMSVSLDLLTAAGWDNKAFNIHWTQNCANDSIIVDPPAHVPEPGTLALLPLGLLGLAALRRRKAA